ncbi:MAG: glycosyltransferase N-terminal domain-containing protein [Phycisphaerae bacterium]
MRALTDAAYFVAAIFTSPLWLSWLFRTGQQRTDWRARFGFGEPLPRARAEPRDDAQSSSKANIKRGRILVHAVSMGEVNAARLLVERLCQHCEVVLSATTDTGFARALAVAPAGVSVVRYPLDMNMAVERFLNRVQPDLVALVELEAWPNFIRACTSRGIPIAVVNGRISDRGFKRYKLARWFLKPLFKRFRFVSAQTQIYADRFVHMGVPAERVHVGGTMKWDAAHVAPIGTNHAAQLRAAEDAQQLANDLARELGIDTARPLVVAGSTAEGEEKLLHACVPEGVQLLCAPRKPARFDVAARDLPGCVRRTQRPIASGDGQRGSDRFLLDTMGELKKAYALATVVVVGRSFGDLHGSDMMEPVALGKATIIGPRYGDFADTAQKLLDAGGMLCVTREALPRVLQELIVDASARQRLVEAALGVIRREQGATMRNEMLLRELLQETIHARAQRATAGRA